MLPQPLITAIMPTRDRPEFAAEAVSCFHAQTWGNRELVILDDADAPSFAEAPAGTRYLRLDERQTIAQKRNAACALADGELIAHWDDDDWSAPDRMRDQAERLLATPGAQVTGYRSMLFEDREHGQWWMYATQANYAVGSSLMFRRSYWERNRFPEVDQQTGNPVIWGEDTDFTIRAANARALCFAPADGLMVASSHPGNTSKRTFSRSHFTYCRMLMVRKNLGSCDQTLVGYSGVDLCPGPGVDEVADLSQPWPWPDNSVDEIRAYDIIEHLPSKIHTMNEAWRVLKPGGKLDIKVPTTDGPGAFQDPTHVSFWNRHSFWYFTQGIAEHTRFHHAYGIKATFRVASENHRTWPSGVVDLNIVLEAIKPEDAPRVEAA